MWLYSHFAVFVLKNVLNIPCKLCCTIKISWCELNKKRLAYANGLTDTKPERSRILYNYVCFITKSHSTLQWRHNDHDGVSNHQPHGCLLNRLFSRRSKKSSKLRVAGLCVGKSPGPVNSPHKETVTRKMFPFDDVIMFTSRESENIQSLGVVHTFSTQRRYEWNALWVNEKQMTNEL